MNEPVIFNNPEFGEIRIVSISGEPWFVGKDVTDALGYSNPRDAMSTHVDDEDKATVAIHDGSQNRNMTIINESGMYSLIFSSKLERAKEFKRWVTSEVLPSIRKNGGYIAGQEDMAPEELLAQALLVAQRTLEEQSVKLSTLEAENRKLMNELHRVPPVDTWSPLEFERMLACAFEQKHEDYITVLYLSRRLGLTYTECFAIETETAKKAYTEKLLTIRGRGAIPLDCLSRQRLRRHLTLDNPGRRLLIPDRRWMSQTVEAFQAFLELYWPYAQEKNRSISNTNPTCRKSYIDGTIKRIPAVRSRGGMI